ncbi:hypothetical protein AUJ10_01850 [Candidatus Pacearchaeota archaeon CG1_02_31_27]|nr:MAG: hypothetical protein AUJ10_01850 [Candidatus Pacearchaeota archaeon CG1_02_31_27]PIN92586.1 MAG: beta-CASP ribonuclease aCPSF1 [Candidatus Pacearchaeota archaeon CG10_big_fil_rev_8_21_14_0_10_31_59]PIZ80730.1 MAG: beta-CASP ribonuclease aCPSF1 [Candidatus Pacearchaeota archaeon CG_4_10_14_0_2_um_filter_31_10]
MEIIRTILDELPKGKISSAAFEAANIVIYTQDKDFFLDGEVEVKKVVDKIKKRISLRADESLLWDEAATEKFIRKLISAEAEITQIIFDNARSIVIIESKKPGLAIGKNGELLQEVRKNTFWTPTIRRSPAIRSKITEAIRQVLYTQSAYRKKFLNALGKKIYTDWDPTKKEEWVRVTFLGSARQVGRSAILLQTPNSKILMDCGIDTSQKQDKDKFPIMDVPEFNLKELDAIILTHAHLDHSGLIPYLFKMGFRGPVYMTAPTRDTAALLALDFIGVAYKKASSPLFSITDVKEMVKHTITVDYNVVTDIAPDVRLTFYNAGHTLGSAMVHLNIGNGLHNLLYTGDFKYARTRVLDASITKFPRVETVIMESTYGGKENILPSRREAEKEFAEAIKKIIERKGKILVPVLGTGRAQEIMLIVEDLILNKEIPDIPIYVDGLVWDITAIHTAYPDFLSNTLKGRIFKDENPFGGSIFKRVGSSTERKEVLEKGPCVILATSGMLVGGASIEYFKNMADNKKNGIIFVSYLGSGSLGREVKDGAKEVKIEGEDENETINVGLEVFSIESLTGHSTRNELMAFVNNMNPAPRRIIVNHGEQSRCLDLASSIHKVYKVETTTPRNLETIRLR